MDFHPPISERSTQELLKMTSDAASWQPEARALARMELVKRGVEPEAIKVQEKSFSKASFALEELRERHAKESYPFWKLLLVFLGAPFMIAIKYISGIRNELNYKLGLSHLDRRNYKKKYRQRLAALILGTLFWIILFSWLRGL
jgi:hypothetical protein